MSTVVTKITQDGEDLRKLIEFFCPYEEGRDGRCLQKDNDSSAGRQAETETGRQSNRKIDKQINRYTHAQTGK